jgi:Protein of unknown function (DUF2569)
MEIAPNEPKGIGGWLLLPALGLIITPFRVGFQFYRDLLPALAPETWNALTISSSAAYHPLWGPLIIFEVIGNLTLFIYAILLLWFFFNKSQRVPKLYIIWLVLVAAIQIIDFLLANQIPAVASQPSDPESVKEVARSIVAAAIWIPYFLKSKRVKNTFIKPAS